MKMAQGIESYLITYDASVSRLISPSLEHSAEVARFFAFPIYPFVSENVNKQDFLSQRRK